METNTNLKAFTIESLHAEVEVFDFLNKWPLAEPHLEHPRVLKALVKGMNGFCDDEYQRLLKAGHPPARVNSLKFDPAKGPWYYTPDNRWLYRARALMEYAIERGEFKCRCANPDLLTPEERAEYDWFEARFYPQPGTYQWYQCYHACHRLAPWLKELGKRAFPQWSWTVIGGDRHSVAAGLDSSNQIRIIFDILGFEQLSAIEVLEFTNQIRPQHAPELVEAKFNLQEMCSSLGIGGTSQGKGSSSRSQNRHPTKEQLEVLRGLPRFRLVERPVPDVAVI